MKYFILIILSCFLGIVAIPFQVNAQIPDFAWATKAQGKHASGGAGMGNSIAHDGQGNTYVAGSFKNNIAFGSYILTSDGDWDTYIAKYDATGNCVWAKRAGGTGEDWGTNIAVDGNGNSYVIGRYTGNITIGSTTLTGTGIFNTFIVKYDVSGNVLWAKQANSARSNGLIVDGNGNSFITGYFINTITFGSISLTSSGQQDIFLVKYDANGNVVWGKRYGGPAQDYGRNLAIDGTGNLYLTGDFVGSATFGSTSLTATSNDMFITKCDDSGNVIWAKRAGGLNGASGSSIAVDDNGNSYVTGGFQNSSTFGSISLTSNGGNDVFIAKYDASGNIVWVKNVGGSGHDTGYDIVVDGAGNSYLTGAFEGSTTLGSTIITSNGGTDIFVTKLDASGNAVWAKSSGGTSYDYGNSIALDGNGNTYVTGTFWRSATFGSYTFVPNNSDEIFIANYDPSGLVVLALNPTVFTAADNGNAITVDNQGNSYATGYFNSSISFGNITLNASGFNSKIFIVKYDGSGNVEWAKSTGGTGTSQGLGITVDGSGNSYITGSFQGTVAFGSITLISSGGRDFFIAKYDALGNVLWAKRAGGTSDETGNSIAIDNQGNSYVTGQFNVSTTFGTNTFYGTGSDDVFVAKFDPAGILLWVKNAGGANYDSGRSIGIDGSGNSYIAGYFYGTISFGTTTLSSSGTYDIFIAKYDASGNLVWVKNTGGAGSTTAIDIAVDGNGNNYAVGFFSGSTTFGSTILTSNGDADFFIAKYDALGNVVWAKSAGGTGSEVAYGISIDGSGSSYITGYFNGSATYNGTTLNSAGGYDVLLVKYDALGNVVWAKGAGGTGSDIGNGIAVDGNGNSFVTGNFTSPKITFGSTSFVNAGTEFFAAKILTTHSVNTTSVTPNNFCQGSSVSVAFNSTGTFNAGNIFTAQLSDATGSFASPQNIGTGTASPIAATIPISVSAGTGYRIRVVSSSPFVVGFDNGSDISISGQPIAPTTTAGVSCGPGSVTLTAAGAPAGGSYRWYMSASGGTAINGATSDTYVTPVINTSTTYYVSVVNSSGCESARTAVTATVDNIPLAPFTTNVTKCGPSAFMLTATGGSGPNGYRWYTTASGGTEIGPRGDTYATPILTTTTTFYVAVVSANGCESSRTPVTATVKSAVASPIVTNATICGPGSAILTAAGAPLGGSYVWYTLPSGGNFIVGETGPTYTTPFLTSTTTYYVAAFYDGCESPRVAVTATVNPAIMPPTANEGSNCGPGVVSLTAMGAPGGGPYNWYTTASGGTPINGVTSATYITPVLTATTTYYVSYSSNGCETSRTPVTATINPLPGSPVASYNNPIATGGTLQLSATTVSGATYSWTGPNGFISSLQNPTISNVSGLHAGTYSVTAIVNGCPSAIATVNVEMILAVSGVVRSEHNTPINTVMLSTTGGTIQASTTNATGAFSFNFNSGGNYTISAAKNNDVVANNGVTTLDIALVRRHLLGGQPLGSPYKILAADVNASGTVTTADIAQMRSLILTTITSFGGEQWKFVPANYMFPNPANPFPFTSAVSTLNLANLSSSQTVDLIGLKLGDVNNTWDNTIARLQAAGDLHMMLPARQVQPQDTVLVPVRVKDFTNVSGFQFTMEWDKQLLQFIGLVPAALQAAYGQHQVTNGKLTTSWDEPAGQSLSLADSTIIFQLRFKAIGPLGALSPVNITSTLTKAESYNNQLAPLNLLANTGQVQIGGVTGVTEDFSQGYAFFQNYPNPFSANTTFSFALPKAEEIKLTIYNSLGQIVATHQANYSAGEHQLELNNINLVKNLSSGAYFVSFTAGGFSAVKKILVLK